MDTTIKTVTIGKKKKGVFKKLMAMAAVASVVANSTAITASAGGFGIESVTVPDGGDANTIMGKIIGIFLLYCGGKLICKAVTSHMQKIISIIAAVIGIVMLSIGIYLVV